jgi:hypothetical protein
MSTLLDDVDSLDKIINSLVKQESQMRSGQFIQAHRECCRLIGIFSQHRKDIIAEAEKTNDK